MPTTSEPLTFEVGDFVSEVLVTDTRTYEVIRVTPSTIRVRTTRAGETLRSDNRDGAPFPVVWTEAVSDPSGTVYTLRRRNDGTFRFGRNSGRFRPATRVDGRPTTYTDYRF